MAKTTSDIRFKAKLHRPAEPGKGAAWTFLVLPTEKQPEPTVPADLRKALAAAPDAKAVWSR